MERYKCRFCFKSFLNGRALGGHMRSHMLTLPSKRELYELTERPSQLSEETESDASSSSDEEEEEDHANWGEFESETESSRMNPTRKRTKRTRKLGSFDFDDFKKVRTSQPGCEVGTEPEHHSSTSDTTTEEDLALCLIMLSRDKWKQQKNKTIVVEDDETDHEREDYKPSKNRGGRGRGRFKCETCGKVFNSYQALGGHRASHKKNKTFTTMTSTKTEHEKIECEKVHQCPICFRVFTSGQALGGHKRSHGSNNVGSRRELSVNQSVPSVKEEEEVSVKQTMIDLNLPAPNEDDETSVVFNEW